MTINEEQFQISMEEGLATAKVVNLFNDLFDSVNGSDREITEENELRRPVTEDSEHYSFWVSAKNILRNMCYVDKISHEIVRRVPSLSNWKFTIDGFQKLWTHVHSNYGFSKLNTRYCNQDPLENFFGLIRSHAVRNTNPTPRQFEDSFITLLVSNMKSISIIGGNCETADDSSMLFSLQQCLTDVSNVEVDDVTRKDTCIDEPLELFSDNVVRENLIVASLSEHCTEIIDLILKQVNYCSECKECFQNSEFLVCAKQLVSRINKFLQSRSHRRNILHVLLQHFELYNVNISWHECTEHHANIFRIMVRAISVKTIVWWCERKNKIIEDDSVDLMQCEARENIVQIKRMRAFYKSQKHYRKQKLKTYQDAVRQNRLK